MADTKLLDSDLLMWKQPAKTGSVLITFNVLFLLVVFLDLSIVPFFCNLCILAIIIGGALKFAAPQISEQNLELMSKDAITAAVEGLAAAVNAATVHARDIGLWTKNSSTVKALVFLQVLRQVAPFISLIFLLFVGVNLGFILPWVLETKKDEIDKSIGPHIKKIKALKDELLAKVPKYTDVVKEE